MEQNNTGQYIKYAIGEIILVMVGILLALQVSNWNASREKTKLEHATLSQLKNDAQAMLGDLKGDYQVLKMGSKSHLNVLTYLEQGLTYNDTMCFDFEWLIKDEYMYPITASYDLLKKEGLELIKNDSIRMITQRTFEFVLPRISKQNPFYPDLENFFSPYFQKHFTPNTDPELEYRYTMYDVNFKYPYTNNLDGAIYEVYFGYVPNDFEALKNSTEFKTLLKQSFKYRSFKVNRYRMAIYWLELLTKQIDEELNITNDD